MNNELIYEHYEIKLIFSVTLSPNGLIFKSTSVLKRFKRKKEKKEEKERIKCKDF